MNKNDDVRPFLTHDGECYPVEPNAPIIKRWEPKEGITGQVLVTKIYQKDLHISDANKRPKRFPKVDKDGNKIIKVIKRGNIRKYSFGASKRCKFVSRNIAHLMNVVVDLTYPNEYPMDGREVKKHLHKFLLWLRYYEYQYFWVLEFQERGAPHFHILVDKRIPYEDVADIWYKIVGSQDPKHLQAGTRVRAIRARGAISYYLTSYMNKAEQKAVPEEYKKVGRFWGCSKDLLKYTEMRFYGNREDIDMLKGKLKIARHFDRGQKKVWSRKRKQQGRKDRFKKFYNPYRGEMYSLKVTNSDKLREELVKRGSDLFPYQLLELPLCLPIKEKQKRKGVKSSKDEQLGLSL